MKITKRIEKEEERYLEIKNRLMNYFKLIKSSNNSGQSRDAGFCYGINPINKSLIELDRKTLGSPTGFILGTKDNEDTFTAKEEIINAFINTNDDIIIIDPTGQYDRLVTNLGGEIINICNKSSSNINPFEISLHPHYESNCPPIDKYAFIINLYNYLIPTGRELNSKNRDIIETILNELLADYDKSSFQGDPPTIKDFYNKLKGSKDTKILADILDIFIKEKSNMFNSKTNIKINNRVNSFNISKFDKKLQPLVMLLTLEYIWDRSVGKLMKEHDGDTKKRGWIYINKIDTLFNANKEADYLYQIYRLSRPQGIMLTGVTHNVEPMLETDTGSSMICNSDFIQTTNQAYTVEKSCLI